MSIPVLEGTRGTLCTSVPSAAHLARGVSLDEAGPALFDPTRLPLPPRVRRGDECEGVVLAVDRFGNLITSLVESDVDALRGKDRRLLEVTLGTARLPLVRTDADVATGELCALVGSSSRLEIAANSRRAADLLEAVVGTAVRLGPRA